MGYNDIADIKEVGGSSETPDAATATTTAESPLKQVASNNPALREQLERLGLIPTLTDVIEQETLVTPPTLTEVSPTPEPTSIPTLNADAVPTAADITSASLLPSEQVVPENTPNAVIEHNEPATVAGPETETISPQIIIADGYRARQDSPSATSVPNGVLKSSYEVALERFGIPTSDDQIKIERITERIAAGTMLLGELSDEEWNAVESTRLRVGAPAGNAHFLEELVKAQNEKIAAKAVAPETVGDMNNASEIVPPANPTETVHQASPSETREQLRGRINALEAIITSATSPEELDRANEELSMTRQSLRMMEIAAEQKKETLDIFQEKFGISTETLEQIDGFQLLSSPQQRLVLETLAQLTVGRMREDAKTDYELDVARDRATKSIFGNKYLGNVWVSARESFLGKKHLLEKENDLKIRIQQGGMEAHGDILVQIVKDIGSRKIEADFDARGEVQVRYAKEWEGIDDKGKRMLTLFNQLASEESKRSYEDHLTESLKSLRKEKDQPSEFEQAKSLIMEQMRENGIKQGEILSYIADLDANIMKNRFVISSDDAIAALEAIDDKNIWTEVAKSVGTERGLYAVGGYVGRTVAAGALGVFAAPAVASLLGGFTAWNRADAEMRSKDRAQRYGKKQVGDEAKNMISASGERGAIQRLSGEFSRIDELTESLARATAEGASDDSETVRTLSQRRGKLLMDLYERVKFTEDKLRLGEINFGERSTALLAQYNLMNEIAKAKVRLENVSGNKRVQDRLAVFLDKKESRISWARLKKQIEQTTEGALMAAGFAYLGGMIREWTGVTPTKVLESDRLSPVGGAVSPNELAASPAIVAEPLVQTGIVEVVDVSQASAALQQEIAPITYRIESGNTLYGILRTQVPQFHELRGGQVQEGAMANFLKTLTPDELRSIGITSGDPELIKEGEQVNITKLTELVQERSSVIDDAMRRFGTSEPVDVTTKTETGNSNYPESDIVEKVVSSTDTISTHDMNSAGEAEISPILNTPEAKEKLALLYEKGNRQLYDAAFWSKAEQMTVEDFLLNNGLSNEERLLKDTIELEAKLKGLVEHSGKPQIGEKVGEFIQRLLALEYEKNPALQDISQERLDQALTTQLEMRNPLTT